MTQTICILGRQPALGLAELESLLGSKIVHPLGKNAALLDVDPDKFNINRLGGSIKLASLLTIFDTTKWDQLEKLLLAKIVEHSQYLPDGKLTFGLSIYGLSTQPARINATALSIKKAVKSTGRPVRVIPNKTLDLSSAQVIHNNLIGKNSWELILISHGGQTYLGLTQGVQDIEAYAARDQVRPKRDPRVGMLPPKLAQIIINLAVGALEKRGARSKEHGEKVDPHTPDNIVVLDPFCGTGVVLQESLLMGYEAYGTDLESRMVEYSTANLEWLGTKFKVQSSKFKIEVGDATNHNWNNFDAIACETYLGRPFSALPSTENLRDVMSDVDTIIKKFLLNAARQTKPGFQLCLALPAWKTKHGFTHLKTLDNLSDLGYTRSVFTHVDSSDLIYHRPEQIVARELVILVRK